MSYNKLSARFLSDLRRMRVPSEATSVAALEFLQSLDCPRALTVALLFKYGEHEQLAKLEFDPLHYLTMVGLRDAYAATKLLSKYKGLTLDYDLDKVALQKFDDFELLCKQTNIRFRNLSADPKYRGSAVWLHNAVIRKIETILGGFGAEELYASANWGPGATTRITSRDASSTNKFQSETGITRDLYALLPADHLRDNYPSWFAHLSEIGYPQFQIGNKVVTVPKDATTNRVIAIEPGINLWFQKAIGEMLSTRLMRRGIDLRYQSVNQELSKLGSETLELATIDFSSASDSIASQVVEAVLPPKWFELLNGARSHFGIRENGSVRWNKFSSMGNGFTFQLESLLFYAIATACMEYLHITPISGVNVSVYGDDVIIPVKCLELFSEMSTFYGFKINMKKSHFASCFRESCGVHFLSGIDVTPIYLKDKLTGVLSLFRLANAIRRLAHRRNGKTSCDARLKLVFNHLVNQCPPAFRLRIPETLGDGGFVSNFDEATPSRGARGITRAHDKYPWVEGFFVNHVTESASYRFSEEVGLLLTRLWVPSMKAERNTVPLRSRTKLRISRSLVQQWYDLGPWQ